MAKPEMVMVKALYRGQLANLKWVDENSPPFEVEKTKVSKRWMKELSPAEVKALGKAASSEPDAPMESLSVISAERDELRVEVESLKASLAAMTDERDKMDAAGRDLAKKVSDLTTERDALQEKLKPKPASVAGAAKA